MKDRVLKKNVLLKDHSTYKIGGPAEYFFIARTRDDLVWALEKAKELKLPVFIFGGGSNILFSDKGVRALVVKMQNEGLGAEKEEVRSGAGVMLNDLVGFCVDNGLSGMEWAAGIPGTVGGAVFGNAQAFGSRMSDSVKSVEAIDLKTLKFATLSNQQCEFSLKSSIFKRAKKLMVVSATFCAKRADKKAIRQKIKEYLLYRKQAHPLDFPSAGSVFINPESKDGSITAGCLIEEAGLAGKRIGNAQISEKHANFIINLGGASAKDVAALVALARKEVEKKFKIRLEPEIQFIGF